jgi:HK97 family phage major capsid protein
MDDLTQMENTVHEYRKALEQFAARKDADTHEINKRGSGEEREKIARMDADLDAAERLIQLRSQQKRIAELESRAEFETRAPKGGLGTDCKEYSQRWINALVSGNPMEMRALSLSSSGAAIPTDMERRIVERLRQQSVIRALCSVVPIDSKRTITVENALPTTALVTEGGSISASDPSFSTAISVVPYKFATRVTMSQEFIEDAIGQGGIGGGLNYVADKCAMSIALSQEEYLTIGTGSSQPEGIETASITQIETIGAGGAGNSASDDLTGDMLINCVHRISPQYRSGARFSWIMHDSLVQHIRKIKVNTTDYVWKLNETGGLSQGAPGTIYGIPYRLSAYLNTATDTTNGNVVAVVGNFEYMELFERTGVTSLLDPYSAASTHQTNLYLYNRWDSHIMLPEAFASITV